jgi:tripartite-type tricarboxylate transporter receptor subunit TctC
MKFISLGLGLVLGVVSLIVAPRADATTDEGFYARKRVIILVSSTPGGGIDLRGRLLGRHLSKYVPGKPTVIVQNMPGGGHLLMNNYLNNIAKPDGLTIGTTPRGIYWYQLMRIEQARFDLTRVSWIGSTSGEDSTLVARSNLGYTSLEDVRGSGKTLILAAAGRGTSNYIYAQILQVALAVPIKVVVGYPGTPEIKAAISRGEVDGLAGRSIANLLSLDKEEMETKSWTVLVQSGEKRHPEFSNVPTMLELAPTQEAKSLIRAATADAGIGWPFYVPSGVPPDRVHILRKAFMDTMKDPAFLQEARKLGYHIDPISGEQLDEIVKDALSAPPAMLQKLRVVYSGPEEAAKKKP